MTRENKPSVSLYLQKYKAKYKSYKEVPIKKVSLEYKFDYKKIGYILIFNFIKK